MYSIFTYFSSLYCKELLGRRLQDGQHDMRGFAYSFAYRRFFFAPLGHGMIHAASLAAARFMSQKPLLESSGPSSPWSYWPMSAPGPCLQVVELCQESQLIQPYELAAAAEQIRCRP